MFLIGAEQTSMFDKLPEDVLESAAQELLQCNPIDGYELRKHTSLKQFFGGALNSIVQEAHDHTIQASNDLLHVGTGTQIWGLKAVLNEVKPDIRVVSLYCCNDIEDDLDEAEMQQKSKAELVAESCSKFFVLHIYRTPNPGIRMKVSRFFSVHMVDN